VTKPVLMEPDRDMLHDGSQVPLDSIETYTGKYVSLSDPQLDQISIDDIARSLAVQCRFCGHCKAHYSIAEHSVHVHDQVMRKYGKGGISYAALMHDAAEAYLGDVTRPLKALLPDYKTLEARMQGKICERFGVPLAEIINKIVKVYDDMVTRAEAFQLMPSQGVHWGISATKVVAVPIRCYRPNKAAILFLKAFNQYYDEAA